MSALIRRCGDIRLLEGSFWSREDFDYYQLIKHQPVAKRSSSVLETGHKGERRSLGSPNCLLVEARAFVEGVVRVLSAEGLIDHGGRQEDGHRERTGPPAGSLTLQVAFGGAMTQQQFRDQILGRLLARGHVPVVRLGSAATVDGGGGELDYFGDLDLLKYCLLVLFEHVDALRRARISWRQFVLFAAECSPAMADEGDPSSSSNPVAAVPPTGRVVYLPPSAVACRELRHVTAIITSSVGDIERGGGTAAAAAQRYASTGTHAVLLSVSKNGRSALSIVDSSLRGTTLRWRSNESTAAAASHDDDPSAEDAEHADDAGSGPAAPPSGGFSAAKMLHFDADSCGAIMCASPILSMGVVACAFFDAIRVVDRANGTVRAVLDIPATISALRWVPSIGRLVAGDREGGVSEYCLADVVERVVPGGPQGPPIGSECYRRPHSDSVTDVLEETPGKLTITSSMDGTLALYHRETGVTRVLRGAVTLRMLLVRSLGYILSYGVDALPVLWPYNVHDAKPLTLGEGRTKPHPERIIGVGLVAESGLGLSVDRLGCLKVWDLAAGVCIQTAFVFSSSEAATGQGYLFDVSLCLPASKHILLANKRRQCMFRFNESDFGRCHMPKASHDGPITSMSFLAESMALVTTVGAQTVRVWSAVNGSELLSFPVLTQQSVERAVVFGERLDGTRSSTEVPRIDRLVAATLDPHHRTVSVASSTGVIGTYSAGTGAERHVVIGQADCRHMSLTGTGALVVSGSCANPEVLLPVSDRNAPGTLRRVTFSTSAQSVRIRLASFHSFSGALMVTEDVLLEKRRPPASVTAWRELPSGAWTRDDAVTLLSDALPPTVEIVLLHGSAHSSSVVAADSTGNVFLLRCVMITPTHSNARRRSSTVASASGGGTVGYPGEARAQLTLLGRWRNAAVPTDPTAVALTPTSLLCHPHAQRLLYLGDDQGGVRLIDAVEMLLVTNGGHRDSLRQGGPSATSTLHQALVSFSQTPFGTADEPPPVVTTSTEDQRVVPAAAAGLTADDALSVQSHLLTVATRRLSRRMSAVDAPAGDASAGNGGRRASQLPSAGDATADNPPPAAWLVKQVNAAHGRDVVSSIVWMEGPRAHFGRHRQSEGASGGRAVVATSGHDGHIVLWSPFFTVRYCCLVDNARLPPLGYVMKYPPWSSPPPHDAHRLDPDGNLACDLPEEIVAAVHPAARAADVTANHLARGFLRLVDVQPGRRGSFLRRVSLRVTPEKVRTRSDSVTFLTEVSSPPAVTRPVDSADAPRTALAGERDHTTPPGLAGKLGVDDPLDALLAEEDLLPSSSDDETAEGTPAPNNEAVERCSKLLKGVTPQRLMTVYRDWAYGLQRDLAATSGAPRRLATDVQALYQLTTRTPKEVIQDQIVHSPAAVASFHRHLGPPPPRPVTLPPVGSPVAPSYDVLRMTVAVPPQGLSTVISVAERKTAIVRAMHDFKESVRRPVGQNGAELPAAAPSVKQFLDEIERSTKDRRVPTKSSPPHRAGEKIGLVASTSAHHLSTRRSVIAPAPARDGSPFSVRHARAAGGVATLRRVTRFEPLARNLGGLSPTSGDDTAVEPFPFAGRTPSPLRRRSSQPPKEASPTAA